MRIDACAGLSLVRRRERAGREVLRRVRDGAHGRAAPRWRAGASSACSRATPRLRPLCRLGRVHRCVGGARRRGHPRTALALLRDRPHRNRALRRDGREVHRRRRHGRLGSSRRTGGRRGARSARRARPRRRRKRAGRRGRRVGASGACRSPDRGSGGHARSGGPGDGRGRSREHGLTHPVRRRSGDRAGRRDDEASD